MYRKTHSSRIRRTSLLAALTSPIEQLETRLLFNTYSVTTLGDSAGVVTQVNAGKVNATTLRAAITAANAHAGPDTIVFAAAVRGTIDLGSALPAVNDATALVGPGPSKLTVQRSDEAAADFSIFSVGMGVKAALAGLTIAKGTGSPATDSSDQPIRQGGGIDSQGNLTLTNCLILDNTATQGGGIYADQLTLNNCTVIGNVTNADYADDPPYIELIAGNGGGIDAQGPLQISNSAIKGNTAGASGGGVYSFNTLTISDSTLSGNAASQGNGGAIETVGETVLTGCSLSGNSASPRTGGLVDSGGASESGSDGFGGAIDSDAPLRLANCTIVGNSTLTGTFPSGPWGSYVF